MKKNKSARPLLGKLFRKLAPKIGATVVMEPVWNFVGQVTFKNGRKCYFRYSTLDLNPVGASDVAKDKDYATFFMKRMGYPTVPGTTFFSNDWSRAIHSRKNIDAGYRYAAKIGFPVFVKPNSGSQGGAVAKVYTKRDFYRAMRAVFKRDRVALVQPPVSGKDYRVVVLDEKVISAYERIPLNIIGDGRTTVRGLLVRKQAQFVKTGRDTIIRFEDKRIAENLKRQGLTMRSVIARGERVYLLDNANLSTGGDAVDVTSVIHPEFRQIAIRLTEDMGLRFCGVDLMVHGDISEPPAQYWVLEVNAAPGLDHYVRTGKAQQKIVEDMYLEVLKAMQGTDRRTGHDYVIATAPR
jgi:D-alanine-D-alanine ligase-like ATP-grasp enzyme